jgi:quinol-cytochrome oxidoreductase complex cytochrome b subunit
MMNSLSTTVPFGRCFWTRSIPYVSGIIIIVLAAIPLVDRKQVTDPRKRKAMIIGILVLISIFISLMIAGAIAPIEEHL